MLQVLDYGNRATKAGSSIGSAMGQGVGQGLSGALGQYANIKINDILQRKQEEHEERMRQKTASEWSRILEERNFDPQAAKLIGMMAHKPEVQEKLMQLFAPDQSIQQSQPQQAVASNMNNGQGQPMAIAAAMQSPQQGQQSVKSMYPPPGDNLSYEPRVNTSGAQPNQFGSLSNLLAPYNQFGQDIGQQQQPQEPSQYSNNLPIPMISEEAPRQTEPRKFPINIRGSETRGDGVTKANYLEKVREYEERKGFKEREFSFAKQQHIDKSNEPFLKEVRALKDKSDGIIAKVNSAREMLDTGKVAFGMSGYKPLVLQNTETQRYFSAIEEMVNDMLKGTGPSTKFKIDFMRGIKPSLTYSKESQHEILNRLEAQAQSDRAYANLTDEKILENDGEQPKALEQLVNRDFKKIAESINKHGLKSVSQGNIENQQDKNTYNLLNPEEEEKKAPWYESPLGQVPKYAAIAAEKGVIEPLLGGTGSLISLGADIAKWATGGRTSSYSEWQKENPEFYGLPTMEQVAKVAKKITSGYTEPETELQSAWANVTGLIGALMSPAKAVAGLGKLAIPKGLTMASKIWLPFAGKVSLGRALGLTAAGYTGENVADFFGAGEGIKGLTKAAFMLTAGSYGTKDKIAKLITHESNHYKSAFAGQEENINETIKKLEKFQRTHRIPLSPFTEQVGDLAGRAVQRLGRTADRKGSISVNELINARQELRENTKLSYYPKVSGQAHLPKESRRYVKQLDDIISEPINTAGETNPEGIVSLARMEDLYAGQQEMKKAIDFARENMSDKIHWSRAITMILQGTYKEPMKAMRVLLKNKEIREVYIDTIKAAANQSKRAFIRNSEKLDRMYKHEEKKKMNK